MSIKMHLTIGNKVYSSWSFRPWIVMRAKGIPFDETVVPLKTADTSAEIRKVSASGKVPCLVDGDVVVWETLAIMEYLAEKFPAKGIWPRDVAARAHARAISAEMHAGFQSLRSHCQMVITQRFAARAVPEAVQADVARISAIWTDTRAKFADPEAGPFLFGDFTAADGMYAPVVSRFHSYAIALDPVSQAYADAMRAHPAFRAWLAGAVAEPWVVAQYETAAPIEDLRAKR